MSAFGFQRVEPGVWRTTEFVAGEEVDFDIRASSLLESKLAQIQEVFAQIKSSENRCRTLVAHDFVVDDRWSNWCGIENPGFEALYESMKLRWVVAATTESSLWGYILTYESLLPDSVELQGWLDFQGQFMHTEVE